MVATNTGTDSGSLDPEISEELTDEIAAAIAELNAAQAKLDAVKSRAGTEGTNFQAPEVIDLDPVAASAATGQAAAAADPNWVYTHQPNYGTQAPGAAPIPPQGYQQAPNAYYEPHAQQAVPAQPAAPPPPYYAPNYPQQVVTAQKDHIVAGLFGILIGSLGIHKFYLGYNQAGFIMLAVAIIGGIFTLGIATAVIALIGFIEGIMYLIKSQSEFEYLYVHNKREWF